MMNGFFRDGWVFLIPDYAMPQPPPGRPSNRDLMRLSDFVVNHEGHLLKNRSDGRVIRYQTTFNWRERLRILFTGTC